MSMLNRWQAILSVVCLSLSSVAAESGTLEGRVCRSDGQPIKDANVRLENLSHRFEAALSRTDKRGEYRFRNVAFGTYKVSVSSGNVTQGFVERVKVKGNKRVDLKIGSVKSAGDTKGKHLVWVPPRTGSHIGGGWEEVGDSKTSDSTMPDLLKAENSVGFGSAALSKSGVVNSVVGGTRGPFSATQIGVNPHPPRRAQRGVAWSQPPRLS